MKMNRKHFQLIIIIILGIFLRLYLANGSHNFDITSYQKDINIFNNGGNIYVEQTAYNYSPFLFILLGILGKIQQFLHFQSFPFYIRTFITFIDILTTIILFKLALKNKLSVIKTVGLFFLNPISIIISGHHGQFENISILFLLFAIYLYQGKYFRNKILFISSILTIGLIIKHIIIYQIYLFYLHVFKNKIKATLVFLFSCFIFLLTFLPFILEGYHQIITQVFKYGGLGGLYGVTYFIRNFCSNCSTFGFQNEILYKYFFIIGMGLLCLFLSNKNIIKGSLLLFLLFLAFTPGVGAQFFILPIALGALQPSRWYYLYTLIGTLFLLGNFDEMNIQIFQFVNWNTVWLFTILWLVFELQRTFPKLRKVISIKL